MNLVGRLPWTRTDLGDRAMAWAIVPWAQDRRNIGVYTSDLLALQATLGERIARHERSGIGEQDTKAALIVPVLRALGWDVEDLEDVKLVP